MSYEICDLFYLLFRSINDNHNEPVEWCNPRSTANHGAIFSRGADRAGHNKNVGKQPSERQMRGVRGTLFLTHVRCDRRNVASGTCLPGQKITY